MTEAEWLASEDIFPMVTVLQTSASERKLRLLAVASCRLIWHLLRDPQCRIAVEVAERLAEGQANEEEWIAAAQYTSNLAEETYDYTVEAACATLASPAYRAVEETAESVISALVEPFSPPFPRDNPERKAALHSAYLTQSTLARDIFGNPFRPVTLVPAWQSSTVVSLAEAIYAERAFDRLPILADALEDAGCMNRAILDHCRQPGEHVRGCWVVDLVLGKE